MKKIAAIAALLALVTGFSVFAEPDILKSSDGAFGYTPYGTVTSYYGGEDVSVPSEIDGTKIIEIGVMAFFDLNISSADIAEGIETINTNAFDGSSILYVNIPSSVKTVGERAFANCASLSAVTLYSDEIELEKDAFSDTDFIQFNIPCTANKDAMRTEIYEAKGDDNFALTEMHYSLDVGAGGNGAPDKLPVCPDCGFRFAGFEHKTALPFDDVPQDAWYCPYVSAAYDYGILNGKSETVFDPDAGMTCAEAVKIAACIHELMTDYVIDFTGGGEWYEPYFSYARKVGILEDHILFEPNEKITRAQTAYLFSRCDVQILEVNPDVPLTDIPDVHDTTAFAYEILELYRRGIAVGSDEYMTFYPDSQIKRSEAAAFITRILFPDMRITLPKG